SRSASSAASASMSIRPPSGSACRRWSRSDWPSTIVPRSMRSPPRHRTFPGWCGCITWPGPTTICCTSWRPTPRPCSPSSSTTSHGTRPSPTPGRTSSIGSRTARRGSPRRLEPSLDGSPPAAASGPGGDRQPLLALMDGEVPQSCLGVSGEATPRTARQPHDLPRGVVDRAGLGLESPGSGEDVDEDIEVRAGVLTDLSARGGRVGIGVEVLLRRWQPPDGRRGVDASGEGCHVEDYSRCRGRSLFADAHAYLVRRALKRLPAHCVGELPDHLHPQALGHVIVDQDQSVADLQRLIGADDARVALGLRNGADVDDGFFCQGGSSEMFQWILV